MTRGPWFVVRGDDDAALERARRALAGLEGVRESPDLSVGRGDCADAVSGMLAALLDGARPDATARATRVRELALALAQAFEVPPEFLPGLERAALLHDLGRVALPQAPAPEPWKVAGTTRALLHTIPGLEDTAAVIASIWENWDGSGHPGHFVHGSIPLRSRLLRLALDWDDLPAHEPLAERVERLRARAGTWYDPLAVAHFTNLLQANGARAQRSRRIPLDTLQAGHVLAQDLLTSSGVKLLAAGARVTPSLLSVIERRHQNDPVLGGVWVEND